MCGVFYKSKNNKVLGSIGYMFFYYINVQVLIKLSLLCENINLILLIYIIFVIMMFIILNKVKNIIRQNIIYNIKYNNITQFDKLCVLYMIIYII